MKNSYEEESEMRGQRVGWNGREEEESEMRGQRLGWNGRNEYADMRCETGWGYDRDAEVRADRDWEDQS
jgi:hypothetical protein